MAKFKESLKLKALRRQLEEASGKERDEILKQIRFIESGQLEEETAEELIEQAIDQSDEIVEEEHEETDQSNRSNQSNKSDQTSYYNSATVVVMIKLEDGRLAMYGDFKDMNPGKNVFDVEPDDIMVRYLNHSKVENMDITSETTEAEIMAECSNKIPERYDLLEIHIIHALLFSEADEDPRIAKLGYKGKTMDDYIDLFKAWESGDLFNAMHNTDGDEEADEPDENSKDEPTAEETKDKEPEPEPDPEPEEMTTGRKPVYYDF